MVGDLVEGEERKMMAMLTPSTTEPREGGPGRQEGRGGGEALSLLPVPPGRGRYFWTVEKWVIFKCT